MTRANQTRQARAWQAAATARWRTHPLLNFLLVATMGAGKTLWGIQQLADAQAENRIDFSIVVVPSITIKRHWQETAAELGLDFDTFENSQGAVPGDANGIVVTYAQVASSPEAVQLYRRMCTRRHVGVILDEVHHCADDRSWGTAVQGAFERGQFRLLLSGTPFRSDRLTIPFVPYEPPDADGWRRAAPDYAYTYQAALVDQVCRKVYFPRYEGEMRFIDSDGEVVDRTFSEPLRDASDASQRLRTALQPTPDGWLQQLLRDGHENLEELRRLSDPRVGGLIVAIDQRHAQAIARIMHRITNEEPTVVISDDPLAAQRLQQFATGSQRWLIAVRMVAEGVDITRLRVIVYASNVVAPLFLHQTFGRVMRWDPKLDESQEAHVHVPADQRILQVIRDFQAEREAALLQARRANESDGGRGEYERPDSVFVPLGADAERHVETIGIDGVLSPDEIEFGRLVGQRAGVGVSPVVIATILRAQADVQRNGEPTEPDNNAAAVDELGADRRKRLRRQFNQLLKRFVLEYLCRDTDTPDQRSARFRFVHARLAHEMGARPKAASAEQLEFGIERVAEFMRRQEAIPADFADGVSA